MSRRRRVTAVGLALPAAWTRNERTRTLARLPFEAILRESGPVPLYRRIVSRAAVLQGCGSSVAAIPRHLRVDHHTVDKALCWLRQR